jgi:hypothetical protein
MWVAAATAVTVAVAVTAVGSVTEVDAGMMQPLESVTVYMCVPAVTPVKVPAVVLSEPAVGEDNEDTANVYPHVPPAGLTTTVVESPKQSMLN